MIVAQRPATGPSRPGRPRNRRRAGVAATAALILPALLAPLTPFVLAAPAFAAAPFARPVNVPAGGSIVAGDVRPGHARSATATVPDAPGRPTAVAGDTTATVTITPASTGGHVASYRVQVPGDVNSHCFIDAATATSCVVHDLYNGFAYTFVSSAANDGDSSTWSAPSAPVTPMATTTPVPTSTSSSTPNPTPTPTPTAGSLPAPGGVSLVAGTSSLIAAWSPVSGATGYTVTARPGPAVCTVVDTTCVLGAVAGTPYTVTVLAHSATGDSAASAGSITVVPPPPPLPADPPATAAAVLTTDHGQIGLATQGQAITATGTGFAPYSTVTVAVYSAPTNLGEVTAGPAGAFSLRVLVPAALPSGAHTFLAAGVDAEGNTRLITLPVTVAATVTASSGAVSAAQTATLPIPTGGTVWLLDETGLETTVVHLTEGIYTLNRTSGEIRFVPVTGFGGRAGETSSVRYRISDALGTLVTGIYTPVVIVGAGAPILKLPTWIVSSVGPKAAVPVECTLSSGSIARCVVTVTAVVSGHRIAIGYGVKSPTITQDLRQVTVPGVLNELGRFLAARPGGVATTVSTELIQREQTGSTTAKGRTRVLAQSFTLPRSMNFGTGSATVRAADATYLTAVAAKLTQAKRITCTGHADSRENRPATLANRRAEATCAVLARTLQATVHTTGKVDKHPRGARNTPAARARNRRATITITN